MDSLSLSPAAPADLPSIAALEELCFSLPRPLEQLGRALPDFTVARFNGAFAGYADMLTVLDEGQIGNVAVVPEFRRRGIGAALLDSLLRSGAANALSFLTLEVRAGNLPAIALYESRGFAVVGRSPNYYERPREDALFMTYPFS